MKKLLLIAILLFPVFPFFAFATSGACSGHGGVDCSAGAGSTGNVICNDGWTGSSVSYYSMSECAAIPPTPSCVSPVATSCTSQSDVMRHCGQPQLGTMYSLCETDCENQINQYQNEVASYNSCVAQQQQNQQTNLQNQQQQATQSVQQQQAAWSSQFKSACQKLMGPYADYDPTQTGYLGSNCVCQSGYWLDSSNSQCEIPATVCANTLGQYSYPASDRCVCKSGFDGSSGTCVDVRPIRSITQQALDWAKSNQNCKLDSSLSAGEIQQCVIYESNPDSFQWQISTGYQGMPASFSPAPASTSAPTPAASSQGSKALSGVTIGSAPKPKTSAIAALVADAKSVSDASTSASASTTAVTNATPWPQPHDTGLLTRIYHFISSFFKFF